MKSMFILAVIAMMLLAACGGNAAPTTSPGSVSQSTDGNGDGNTPSATTVPTVAYSVQISGDVTLTMTQDDPGGYAAVQINSDGDVNFQFSASNSTRLIDITFQNMDTVVAGIYGIADWEQREELESAVFASINDISDPENLMTLFSTSGTITLEGIDGFYIGNFAFNATGDYGNVHIDEATVVGTFTILD